MSHCQEYRFIDRIGDPELMALAARHLPHILSCEPDFVSDTMGIRFDSFSVFVKLNKTCWSIWPQWDKPEPEHEPVPSKKPGCVEFSGKYSECRNTVLHWCPGCEQWIGSYRCQVINGHWQHRKCKTRTRFER